MLQCILDYKQKNSHLARAYSTLTRYVRDQGLDDEKVTVADIRSHYPQLRKMAKSVLSGFSTIPDPAAFVAACQNPYKAAKVTASFYRQVRKLIYFEKEGFVRFPKPPTEA